MQGCKVMRERRGLSDNQVRGLQLSLQIPAYSLEISPTFWLGCSGLSFCPEEDQSILVKMWTGFPHHFKQVSKNLHVLASR